MPDLVDELRRRIAQAGDPSRAPARHAPMKSSHPFRGHQHVGTLVLEHLEPAT